MPMQANREEGTTEEQQNQKKNKYIKSKLKFIASTFTSASRI